MKLLHNNNNSNNNKIVFKFKWKIVGNKYNKQYKI